MSLTKNIELLAYSINNPEPIYDPAYQKDFLVIERELNALMKANHQLLDYITAYDVNCKTNNQSANSTIIEAMMEILDTPNINTSEFTSFWECCDVSYSIYEKLPKDAKNDFLNRIVKEYILKRHALYKFHGYTPSTLQVKADSFAHKRTGSQGTLKAKDFFEKNGFLPYSRSKHQKKTSYMLIVKGSEPEFKSLLKEKRINFAWHKQEKKKLPDYALITDTMTVIFEHKHMKETGGGQDKQLLEIIRFLQQSDENVLYVSFLDGILFNALFSSSASGKLKRQQDDIYSSMKKHPRSYFLNTAGFKRLLKEISEL